MGNHRKFFAYKNSPTNKWQESSCTQSKANVVFPHNPSVQHLNQMIFLITFKCLHILTPINVKEGKNLQNTSSPLLRKKKTVKHYVSL